GRPAAGGVGRQPGGEPRRRLGPRLQERAPDRARRRLHRRTRPQPRPQRRIPLPELRASIPQWGRRRDRERGESLLVTAAGLMEMDVMGLAVREYASAGRVVRGSSVQRSLIDHILERGSLAVCFQPVLDMRPSPPQAHYLEALIRGPRGTIAEAPAILFEYARKKNKEALVDRSCIQAILEASRGLPVETRL